MPTMSTLCVCCPLLLHHRRRRHFHGTAAAFWRDGMHHQLHHLRHARQELHPHGHAAAVGYRLWFKDWYCIDIDILLRSNPAGPPTALCTVYRVITAPSLTLQHTILQRTIYRVITASSWTPYNIMLQSTVYRVITASSLTLQHYFAKYGI